MKYIYLILILISIGLSIFVINFIVQEYHSYQLLKKNFEEYKQASIQQITINTNDIMLLAKVYNEYINKK